MTSVQPNVRPAAPYYRPGQWSGPNITDDYERWYTEANASNRMVLALRSTLHQEIGWALDRLHRLCDNEQFMLKSIPGLTDALFEWPQWFVLGGYKEAEAVSLFSSPPLVERKRRHALESLLILRNMAINEPNVQELATHPRTLPLIKNALQNLNHENESNVEFILNSMDLLQAIFPQIVLPSQSTNPGFLAPLQTIAAHSTNRSLIIASMALLGMTAHNHHIAPYLDCSSTLVLNAAVRYLPLFPDKPLVDACVNYLYAHLSVPALAKAFLLHPHMPSTLRILISIVLAEQTEETVSLDVTGSVRTLPASRSAPSNHDLSKEEFDRLLTLPEPNRCYEWMKTMFVSDSTSELTQVDFWNLYRDAFGPSAERHPMLAASDVIKNVNLVFPQAQAMVLQGPPQRFVVRGVARRQDPPDVRGHKCSWNRAQCETQPFDNLGGLYEHLLNHIADEEELTISCSWSSCPAPPLSKVQLRSHVLTHLPFRQTTVKDVSDDTITLSSPSETYPSAEPTKRPPPPLRQAYITYARPIVDPPSTSLTALLCARIIYRISFVSTDEAPKADADHFGFPGIVPEDEGEDEQDSMVIHGDDRDGERRGRRAIINIRGMLEGVRIRNEVLMGWIIDMLEAGSVESAYPLF